MISKEVFTRLLASDIERTVLAQLYKENPHGLDRMAVHVNMPPELMLGPFNIREIQITISSTERKLTHWIAERQQTACVNSLFSF